MEPHWLNAVNPGRKNHALNWMLTAKAALPSAPAVGPFSGGVTTNLISSALEGFTHNKQCSFDWKNVLSAAMHVNTLSQRLHADVAKSALQRLYTEFTRNIQKIPFHLMFL